MPMGKVSKLPKTVGEAVKERIKSKASKDHWLPEEYEARKGQTEFIEEASKTIKGNVVFPEIGRAHE